MQALHDVVTAGYVRYIGMSTCRAWQCTSILPLTDVVTSARLRRIRPCLFEVRVNI